MITPVRMSKIIIAGSRVVFKKVVESLHNLGVIHLVDYHFGKYDKEGCFDIGTPFEDASKLSTSLVKTRVLLNSLGIRTKKDSVGKIPSDAEKRLGEIEKKVTSLLEKKAALGARLSELETLREPVEFLGLMKVDQKSLAPTKKFAVFKGIVEKNPKEFLDKITKSYELFVSDYNGKKAVVLFVLSEYREAVQKALENLKYREIVVPAHVGSMRSLEDLNKEIALSEKRLSDVENELSDLKAADGDFLLAYEDFLRREDEKAEAPLRFAVSKNAFVIEGWVPKEQYETLEKTINTEFKGKVYVKSTEEESEFAPVGLQNPKPLDAFEFFVNMYSLPLYKELDPTFLIFLTFPLFFGFMLGDVGYGIVSLAIFYFVRTKWTHLKGLLNAMMLAALASIAFGFLFGEFFGVVMYKPVINREHDIAFMLLITILVGLVHINLGILVGAYNTFASKGFMKALYNNLSWIFIEAGALVFALKYFGVFEFAYTIHLSITLLLVGITLLYKGHGAMGLIELPTMLSNILSYARLFALGLAGVSLALIVNEFATKFWHMGVIYIPVAITILVLGHMINLALGIIGCFLQSLRLHYVEFFTKFYKGGGEKYMPFGR